MIRDQNEKILQETSDPKKYYENESKRHRLWGTQREISLAENILSKVVKNPRSILDVGCGDGFFLAQARLKFPKSDLCGVDLAEHRLELCRKAVPGASFVQADISQLGQMNRKFDVVVCSEVLEHLEYPEVALSELWKVTERQLIVTVPNDQPTTELDCPHCHGKFFLSGHIQRIDSRKLYNWTATLSDAKVELRRFNTIFTYNQATLALPRPLRMIFDQLAVRSEALLRFSKANFLLASITR